MRTPEFVRWTIAHPCSLREATDWNCPDQTERLLRPLRECSRAKVEGRVFEGLALAAQPSGGAANFNEDDPLAFRVEECVAGRGSVPSIEQLCGACPANATLQGGQLLWAGCYGELPREGAEGDLAHLLDGVIEKQGLRQEMNEQFKITRPTWYGLWMAASPHREQKELLTRVFVSPKLQHHAPAAHFLAAVRASLAADLPLRLSLSPQGELTDDAWIVAAHCPNCQAKRGPGRGVCPACGQLNHCLPSQRKKRRGLRPYRPLSTILGSEGAAAFIVRWRRKESDRWEGD